MKSEANKLLVSTIKKLLHRHGRPQLKKIISRSHPADLAYAFHFLTRGERVAFFDAIDDLDKAAELVSELEEQVQREFVTELDDRKLVKLLEMMSSDDTADVLSVIESEDRRELLLTMMRREELATTQTLMEYDPESAGGLMVPDYFALEESVTALEAVKQLQEDAGRTEMVFYIYVINEHGQLVGVLSLRELVLAAPQNTLKKIMTPEVMRVDVDTDQEDVARKIARYNLVALPVVDQANKLVGVVTVDDIIDVIRLEATEDMMLMAGAGEQQVEGYGTAWDNFQRRMPWLLPSFVGGLLMLIVVWLFQASFIKVFALVAALPMVISTADGLSAQSSALVTRGLALGRTDFAQMWRVILSELFVGVLAGMTFALMAALALFALFRGDAEATGGPIWRIIASVSLAQIIAMMLASSIGALTPLVFAKMGRDPAIATGALVSIFVDGLVVVAYGLCALAFWP